MTSFLKAFLADPKNYFSNVRNHDEWDIYFEDAHFENKFQPLLFDLGQTYYPFPEVQSDLLDSVAVLDLIDEHIQKVHLLSLQILQKSKEAKFFQHIFKDAREETCQKIFDLLYPIPLETRGFIVSLAAKDLFTLMSPYEQALFIKKAAVLPIDDVDAFVQEMIKLLDRTVDTPTDAVLSIIERIPSEETVKTLQMFTPLVSSIEEGGEVSWFLELIVGSPLDQAENLVSSTLSAISSTLNDPKRRVEVIRTLCLLPKNLRIINIQHAIKLIKYIKIE